MSKIGNIPIQVPSSVQVKIDKDAIEVSGKEGKLNFNLPRVLEIKQENDKLIIKAKNDNKKTKSVHGLYRQLLYNAVTGVETPWRKKMEVVGTGFNVKLQGEDIVFKIGYSHPVVFKKSTNIKFQVEGNTKVSVLGIDKQLVGQVAFQIRKLRQPDVYKGKGIRYAGEVIKLKPGKKVKAAGTAV
ncbi:50S ribosomal protein L6 [Candidatus Roizmanbacteria bacterium RIFCSPHIGHO2_01_FULL_35_10]|uniref:50S ribosomal protein L6 n=1 Tax=Candidatus Roizmanbacteria bacterium RIFCSPLOWO2_01_FULL_35_13 TaxID=1802055 RepID=A0A1F7I9N8_9BACT|nr:MAG: 50S ribosomal protein L6 [Candidatus Roizmanbacteria bacterium RIFCSPHIGHO2_01_FULL_35_10]OGK40075.1 MAG: 50S ribosomal protein L6 [Candidatus Roizmanbacteria bacterium RIFCSPLOWO2_01_FULL_35_13]